MPSGRKKLIEGSEQHHYESARKRRGREKAKLQPPLTPMIDVTFQLLIFFLLTATMRQDEGQIPGTLPPIGGPSSATNVELQPVRITLRPVGSTYEQAVYEIGQLRLNTPEELYNQLATQRKAAPDDDVPVIIFPSNAVRWEFVTEAFNAAVRARFRKIGFQGETGPR